MMRPTILSLAACALLAPSVSAQFFQPGNVVVVRAGDPALTLSSAAAPLFLEEWNPVTNTLVQTLALPNGNPAGLPIPTPVAPNVSIAQRGFSSTEGQLNLSADGRYLVVGGYAADTGSPNPRDEPSATTPRVIAVVDVLTGLVDTSTALTDAYDSTDFRGVTSDAGLRFWTSGNDTGGSVRFVSNLGATTSLPVNAGSPTNNRFIGIYDFDLYVTSASTGAGTLGVVAVGSGGLPTTGGQAQTLLPGFPTSGGISAGNPYDFWFADDQTLYVADSNQNSTIGGVQKWTFNGTTWAFQYRLTVQVPPAETWGARGLTGLKRNGVNEIWFTAEQPGFVTHLCKVEDTGPSAVPVIVSTEPTETDYRGVRVIGTQIQSIAAGCGAAELQVSGPGLLGTGVKVELENVQGFAFLNFSFTPVGLPLTNCTCTVVAAPGTLVGTDSVVLPIPDDITLIGRDVYVQGIDLFDPAATCVELPFLTLTDGAVFTVR